jgi:hypothetical protein
MMIFLLVAISLYVAACLSAMVLSQAYKLTFLNLKKTTMNASVYGLFISNITPNYADTASTYTAHECTLTGYARITPVFASAINGPTTGDGSLNAPAITFGPFTAGFPQTVYGYFVLDGSGNLIGAETNGGGLVLNTSGQTYTINAPIMAEGSY